MLRAGLVLGVIVLRSCGAWQDPEIDKPKDAADTRIQTPHSDANEGARAWVARQLRQIGGRDAIACLQDPDRERCTESAAQRGAAAWIHSSYSALDDEWVAHLQRNDGNLVIVRYGRICPAARSGISDAAAWGVRVRDCDDFAADRDGPLLCRRWGEAHLSCYRPDLDDMSGNDDSLGLAPTLFDVAVSGVAYDHP